MKCDYCTLDFVRKETYKAHIISMHKQSMTDKEFEEVLEKIRKFQAPQMDVNQFMVEKQGARGEEILEEDAEMEEELIEDEGMDEANEEYEIYDGDEGEEETVEQ